MRPSEEFQRRQRRQRTGRRRLTAAVLTTSAVLAAACGSLVSDDAPTPDAPEEPTVRSLPEPSTPDPGSLEAAIEARRSVRDLDPRALTDEQVGRLLWATQGVTDPTGLRAAPSAGATYPLEVYAVTAERVARYVPPSTPSWTTSTATAAATSSTPPSTRTGWPTRRCSWWSPPSRHAPPNATGTVRPLRAHRGRPRGPEPAAPGHRVGACRHARGGVRRRRPEPGAGAPRGARAALPRTHRAPGGMSLEPSAFSGAVRVRGPPGTALPALRASPVASAVRGPVARAPQRHVAVMITDARTGRCPGTARRPGNRRRRSGRTTGPRR
jgi:nitroreductase